VANAGKKDPGVVLDKVVEGKDPNSGYDANEDAYVENMIKVGIIDPLKVTRTALENAVSVSAMLLTTEAVVTDLPEKKDEHSHGGGMPGMGGMM
jgi:chaperonin GroEL